MDILTLLKSRLKKTRDKFLQLFKTENYEDLEAALLGADVGVKATRILIEKIKKEKGPIKELLSRELLNLFKVDKLVPGLGQSKKEVTKPDRKINLIATKPIIVMIVGVNGSGKTTTIGKLAHKYQKEGKSVLIAAADTYRDAAASQLKIWAERAGVETVLSLKGQDAGSVVFDAIKKAESKNTDIVLVDTAGRLHTRKDLMEEAKKIKRVITKLKPKGPDETFLVLDATVGQNGIAQAKTFHSELGISGIIVCKLDGTAKAGVLIPLTMELNIPIRYIGLGEGIEDLQEFSAEAFVKALFEE